MLSLGGSLIVPNGGIDTQFLNKFNTFIRAQIAEKSRRFFIVCGGGATARSYITAAGTVYGKSITDEDQDWLGIHSTRLNGHLLRTIFRKYSHPRIITNPHHAEPASEQIIIAAGYRPGWSTDYDAVLLARKYKAAAVLNLSNIDYVYDKDPNKFKNAKPIKKISWQDFRKIVGNKWDPGLHLPFDPVASKLAEKLKLKVIIMNGRKLENLKNFLSGKKFKGTVIS